MNSDDIFQDLFDTPVTSPITIVPKPDGMVLIILGESAAEGTWMDAIKLAHRLLSASMFSAQEIGVEPETYMQAFLAK